MKRTIIQGYFPMPLVIDHVRGLEKEGKWEVTHFRIEGIYKKCYQMVLSNGYSKRSYRIEEYDVKQFGRNFLRRDLPILDWQRFVNRLVYDSWDVRIDAWSWDKKLEGN